MIDDLEQLARRLEGWLSAQHPERAPLVVSQLKRSDAGYSNITVLGELSWTLDGATQQLPIVLRVQPQTSSVYPDCDIVRQYRVMQALAGSTVPVPRLLGLETDSAPLGAPFFLMQRIEGRVPNENPLYHLEGWFHDLDAGALRQHWFSGIDTVAAIARLDWRALGLDFLQPPPGRTPLAHQLAYYRDAVAWAERLGRPYPHLHAAFDWLHAHQPADEPVALSWADAKLGNCVYRDGRVAGALDWARLHFTWPYPGKVPHSNPVPLLSEIHEVPKKQLKERAFGWDHAREVLGCGFGSARSAGFGWRVLGAAVAGVGFYLLTQILHTGGQLLGLQQNVVALVPICIAIGLAFAIATITRRPH